MKVKPERTSDLEEIKSIGNKLLRKDLYKKYKRNLRREKRKEDDKKKKLRLALGEEAVPKGIPRTIENAREAEPNMITDLQDEDLVAEEQNDHYTQYYDKSLAPRVLITSTGRAKKVMSDFLKDLQRIIPFSRIRSRKKIPLTDFAKLAAKKGYTDLVVVNEDHKINSMLVTHLPDGPTAFFRISGLQTSKSLKVGAHLFSDLKPEVFLNHFTTLLGRTVSRMLGAVFHYTPNFTGRRAVTIHNQRDFIFVRHHVYQFDDEKKVRLREMGPRFTLKLKWLQTGMMSGDYEFIARRREQQGTSRTKFTL